MNISVSSKSITMSNHSMWQALLNYPSGGYHSGSISSIESNGGPAVKRRAEITVFLKQMTESIAPGPFSLSRSLSFCPPPFSEAMGKPLLSTKYDQTHGIIGFINMPKYNLVKCISGRDNHLQLLRGIWNKYVCMQIRNTFFMYCALAVHESTLDLWQCVCIIAGLGWVDLCWDL